MFLPFFLTLRNAGVPVSMGEFLTFLQGVSAGLVTYDTTGFYHLARTAMVKDERHLDRFDRAFAASFAGLETLTADAVLTALDLPAGWLEKLAEGHLTDAERARIQSLGGFDALMDASATVAPVDGLVIRTNWRAELPPKGTCPKSSVAGHTRTGAAASFMRTTLPRKAVTSARSAGVSCELRNPMALTVFITFTSVSGPLAARRMLLWFMPGSGPWHETQDRVSLARRMYSMAP